MTLDEVVKIDTQSTRDITPSDHLRSWAGFQICIKATSTMLLLDSCDSHSIVNDVE